MEQGRKREVTMQRLATGVPGLDERLGGGLIPGTLTVLVGATGIGKTQLGLQFADAGREQEGRRGIVFDMSYRGDSQSQIEYAQRMFDWTMVRGVADRQPDLVDFFTASSPANDYLQLFDQLGRRPSQREVGFDTYRDWHGEMVSKLNVAIAFFYGNFIRGTRRVVIDGVDPADRPDESFQFELFDYIYHQILRKDADWVARDLFRQAYRQNAEQVAAHRYDPATIGCVMLYTSPESMLESLIERPLEDRDWLANANTVIYLGKTRQEGRVGRALYVAKHRGSACTDEIVPFTIGDRGLTIA